MVGHITIENIGPGILEYDNSFRRVRPYYELVLHTFGKPEVL